MGKRSLKPGTMIYPLPAVIVTCGSTPEEYNMMTAAWTGTICTNPPMCYVSIRPERHSYGIIRREMQFTLNLTTRDMARATDWVGVKSGRDCNKFAETGLTPVSGVKVTSPHLKESPLAVECLVKIIMPLGSHDMFIAEVVNVLADEELFDPQTDALDLGAAGLINYSHGHYYGQGDEIGRFGWSVRKKK